MKTTPSTDNWPTQDSEGDARGLPGYRKDTADKGPGKGPAGGAAGGPGHPEPQMPTRKHTPSSEDDNLAAD